MLSAEDEKVLWNYNRIANDVATISTPVVRGDYVFASTGYGTEAVLQKIEKSAEGVAAKEVYFLDSKTFQNGQGAMGGNIRPEGATGSAAVAYADGHLTSVIRTE